MQLPASHLHGHSSPVHLCVLFLHISSETYRAALSTADGRAIAHIQVRVTWVSPTLSCTGAPASPYHPTAALVPVPIAIAPPFFSAASCQENTQPWVEASHGDRASAPLLGTLRPAGPACFLSSACCSLVPRIPSPLSTTVTGGPAAGWPSLSAVRHFMSPITLSCKPSCACV